MSKVIVLPDEGAVGEERPRKFRLTNNGVPIDLTSVAIKLQMQAPGGTETTYTVASGVIALEDAANGLVKIVPNGGGSSIWSSAGRYEFYWDAPDEDPAWRAPDTDRLCIVIVPNF